MDPVTRFIVWLAGTPWSIALHESLYVYTYVETAHVIGVALFVGTIAMVDLRLLGVAFRQTPVSQMNARVLPFTVVGFLLMFVTGLLLFYAIPMRTWHSIWFRSKLVLMALAGANVWFFHQRVERDRATWDNNPAPPLGARLSAVVSLTAWIGVIVMGRMIAYNWFDCDVPQSPAVSTLAGCSAYVDTES